MTTDFVWTDDQIEDIAAATHEANRAIQWTDLSSGIPVAVRWADFSLEQRVGVIAGVKMALEGASAEQLHESWVQNKVDNGWTYGEEKDEVAKTHPLLIPYSMTPPVSRIKDSQFRAIIQVIAEHVKAAAGYGNVTDHFIKVSKTGWVIQHPYACRPNLYDCSKNELIGRWLLDMSPKMIPGVYRVVRAERKGVVGVVIEPAEESEVPTRDR